MRELIALRPVLYHAHQYSTGESLPVNDQEMTELWLKAGTAMWKEDEPEPQAMAVQIDNNEQIEREKRYSQHMDGIYVKQVLMYVSAEDYGPLPKQGTAVSLDKRSYRVADAIAEDGIYSITLEANRG